jgi:hypothetical protein
VMVGFDRGFAAYFVLLKNCVGFPGLAPWAIFFHSLREGFERGFAARIVFWGGGVGCECRG